MKRTALLLGFSVALGLLSFSEREAAACGGCVVPPNQTASDITDERMLLAVSQQQSTLYDQIRYAGSPESFAWVLPIQGTVDVGLSADVLFSSFDALTATTINPPPVQCPGPPASCASGRNAPSAAADSTGASSSSGGGGGVQVLKQENVGPYATVQIKSTDPNALFQWLSDNGFQIKDDEKPIIQAYVAEGFDFLALKLKPAETVKSMRPVRVTFQGPSLSLPLRMASVGTGAKVGITIWVVADGRYEPQNFPFYRISDDDLVWDFSKSTSNYTDLRAAKDTEYAGRGWEMQSSLTLAQQQISSIIENGGYYSPYGYGGTSSGGAASASTDYLPVDPDGQNPGKTADEVRTEDIAALFAGMGTTSVRVTRMRSDVAKTAMNVDFTLQASKDQSILANSRQATKYTNLQCPVYNNCEVDGYASSPEEAAQRTAANSNDKGDSFSCRTAVRSKTATDYGIAGAFAAIGLVMTRVVRRRRK